MSDPLRPTAEVVFLIDVEVEMPVNGAKVYALGIGGTLAPVTWNSQSHRFFVAWMESPKVPQSVKDRLATQWSPVNPVKSEEPAI